jgi:TRAP-type C4-dicarboxylate transport system permease small subunit
MAVATSIVRFAANLQLWAAAAIFVACVVFYGVEVFARGLLNRSIPEYFEFVGIGFVYVFLFGAAALYGRDEDIVIGYLFDRAPSHARPWWLLLVHALTAATMAATFVATFRIITLQWTTPTPLLGVPEGVRWIPLAIASASITASALVRTVACAAWLRRGERPTLLDPPQPIEDNLKEI